MTGFVPQTFRIRATKLTRSSGYRWSSHANARGRASGVVKPARPHRRVHPICPICDVDVRAASFMGRERSHYRG